MYDIMLKCDRCDEKANMVSTISIASGNKHIYFIDSPVAQEMIKDNFIGHSEEKDEYLCIKHAKQIVALYGMFTKFDDTTDSYQDCPVCMERIKKLEKYNELS